MAEKPPIGVTGTTVQSGPNRNTPRRKVKMQSEIQSVFGPTVSSYSREQAILDGVLVDLSQFENIRQHWKLPMACTDSVWGIIEDAIDQGSSDIAGILHDISCTAKHQIGRNSGDTLFFKCIVGLHAVDLQLHCGPGDDPLPVLTLMQLHES